MKTRNLMVVLAVLLVPAALVLAASWTWTGEGSDSEWSTSENWSGSGWACNTYPACTNDDVDIDGNDEVVHLRGNETVHIDDMTVTGHFTFIGDAGNDYPAFLKVDSLEITGLAIVVVADEGFIFGEAP